MKLWCQCASCKIQLDFCLVEGNFTEALFLCMFANGISPTQMQSFLIGMNFAYKSEKTTFAVDFQSKYNLRLRNTIMPRIVELARVDQKLHFDNIIKSTANVIDISIDGAYPVRGRSSPVAFVSILDRDRVCKKYESNRKWAKERKKRIDNMKARNTAGQAQFKTKTVGREKAEYGEYVNSTKSEKDKVKKIMKKLK